MYGHLEVDREGMGRKERERERRKGKRMGKEKEY